MSPGHREWVSRLKYVVLDEIHCIGEGDEEGRAWERLVQLMPCPFIALSATVGNPDSFHGWLGKAHVSGGIIRHDHKSPIEIIQFGERYADLSTCVYSSDITVDGADVAAVINSSKLNHQNSTAEESVKTDDQIKIAGGLYSLNPFVCLMYKQVLLNGISGDFYVPSCDLLQVRDIIDLYSWRHFVIMSSSVNSRHITRCEEYLSNIILPTARLPSMNPNNKSSTHSSTLFALEIISYELPPFLRSNIDTIFKHLKRL